MLSRVSYTPSGVKGMF